MIEINHMIVKVCSWLFWAVFKVFRHTVDYMRYGDKFGIDFIGPNQYTLYEYIVRAGRHTGLPEHMASRRSLSNIHNAPTCKLPGLSTPSDTGEIGENLPSRYFHVDHYWSCALLCVMMQANLKPSSGEV